MTEYITLKAKDEDIKSIAILHLKAFSRDHFTSRFPKDLLEKYFASLIRLNEFCYVMYTKDRKITLGYIIAGSCTDKAIDEFMKKNKLNVFFVLIKNPGFLFEKVVDKFASYFPSRISTASLRIQIYVSNPEYKELRIGLNLLDHIESEFKKDDHFHYGLSVRKKNSKAINFYIRNNFNIEFETRKSIYFTKNLV